MTSKVLIVDPQTAGAQISKANLTCEREWLQIALKDIIIKIHLADIYAVTGEEGHG